MIDFGLSKHFKFGEVQHEAVGTRELGLAFPLSVVLCRCLIACFNFDVQHIRSPRRLFEGATTNDATSGRLESSCSSFFLASPPLAVVVVPSL